MKGNLTGLIILNKKIVKTIIKNIEVSENNRG